MLANISAPIRYFASTSWRWTQISRPSHRYGSWTCPWWMATNCRGRHDNGSRLNWSFCAASRNPRRTVPQYGGRPPSCRHRHDCKPASECWESSEKNELIFNQLTCGVAEVFRHIIYCQACFFVLFNSARFCVFAHPTIISVSPCEPVRKVQCERKKTLKCSPELWMCNNWTADLFWICVNEFVVYGCVFGFHNPLRRLLMAV